MPSKLRSPNSKPIVLKDVKPNIGIQAWYKQQLESMLDQMFSSYSYFLKASSKKEYNALESMFAQDASQSDEIRKMLKTLGVRWSKKYEAAAKIISESFVERGLKYNDSTFAKKLKDAGFTVDFKMSKVMREAFEAQVQSNVGLIKSIQEKFHSDIEQRVWESVKVGGDVGAIAKGIEDTYGLTKKRARLIARDQNAKAHGLFEAVRRRELGLTKAIWVHSTAGKVPRESHVKANGKEYNIEEGMYIDGEYIFPGQKINCRCTSRAIIPGFNDD
jgi:SPP1 gp7 family putative phage head morphogenesis protein